MQALVLAFSISDQIDKIGNYAAFASIVGVGVMALLYYSQAREVKRLRDWAGRAPERAAELEAQALQAADRARTAPGTPAATPATAAARTAPGGATPAHPGAPAPATTGAGAVPVTAPAPAPTAA